MIGRSHSGRFEPPHGLGTLFRPHIRWYEQGTGSAAHSAKLPQWQVALTSLLRRSNDVLQSKLLGRLVCAPLREWADQVVTNIAACHDAVAQLPPGTSLTESALTTFDRAHMAIDRLEGQLWLVSWYALWGGRWSEICPQILERRTLHCDDLLRLAREQSQELANVAHWQPLRLHAGIAVEEILRDCSQVLDVDAFATGLQVAFWAHRLLAQRPDWRERIPAVMLGAVLIDLGMLANSERLRTGLPGGPRPLAADLARLHATTGSVAASTVRRMPHAIVEIVAGHHEHLDGSGTPLGRDASGQAHFARLVSVVARFVEIHSKYARGRTPSARPEELSLKTLELLQREAARGWWDHRWLERLAETVVRDVQLGLERDAFIAPSAMARSVEGVRLAEPHSLATTSNTSPSRSPLDTEARRGDERAEERGVRIDHGHGTAADDTHETPVAAPHMHSDTASEEQAQKPILPGLWRASA